MIFESKLALTQVIPLRGYMLKSFAALVLVTATNWFSSIFPVNCRKKHIHESDSPHHFNPLLSLKF